MIDYGTYSALHPNADEFTDKSFNEAGPMSEEDMKKDEPPGNGLQLIFPPKISGFSIQDKKWSKSRSFSLFFSFPFFSDHIST
jgi:hypothetical protein